MSGVATSLQSHHSEAFFQRLPARPFGDQASAASYTSRDMAYNSYHHGDCYLRPPAPSKQSPEARSSSATPASSAPYPAPFPAPYTTGPSQHFDSGPGSAVMYARSHCPALAHGPSYAPATQPMSLPSQLIHTHEPPRSMYTQFPSPRQFSRPPPYGGYHGGLPQQPLSLSQVPYGAPLFPSSSSPAYHSTPGIPSYQTTPPPLPASVTSTPEIPKEKSNERFHAMVGRLPPEVIRNIRNRVTYRHCWAAYLASKWFRENFHPDRFTPEEKRAGLVDMEKWGCGGRGDFDIPKPSQSNGKVPSWLACYHCLRPRGLQYFERYKHCTPLPRGESDDEGNALSTRSAPIPRRRPSYTPPTPQSSSPTPPANPHYDPSLTRSSLRASAARNGRDASPATSSAVDQSVTRLELRQNKTFGLLRFCIDCALRIGIYEPGDLVEVRQPVQPNDAVWVCGCYQLRHRAEQAQCRDCGHNCPFSTAVVALRRR